MTELERLLKAKIPGERTGIEIKHSLCAICSRATTAGLTAGVKDGVIFKGGGHAGPSVQPRENLFEGRQQPAVRLPCRPHPHAAAPRWRARRGQIRAGQLGRSI